ncbi:MAG: FAD-binding protein [Egibacteraceae bacterium]
MLARRIRAGDRRSYDVVVLGAGVAGLVTALDLLDLAPGLSVAIIDKGALGTSGSTALAQGGLAAAVGPEDSPARHTADTLAVGDGLADPRAAAVLAGEAPARVQDLIARGAVFDRDGSGAFALAREGGQAVARSVRAADATGAAIFAALRDQATGRVERLQGTACALAVGGRPERVHGAWLLVDDREADASGPAQEAGLVLVEGRAVVLATGGCGGLYAATTNRADATADGVALAGAAGAALVDMEFVQFHPTGLRTEGMRRLLLTEALRGAGAVLVDAHGQRFLPDYHEDAELAPRHVVTRAILEQPGGAWLDASHLPPATLAADFPTVLAGARAHGYDLTTQPVPVEPCQHYMVGGVATDLWARTSLPGLWAAGEVASTGVHGANRMAGNSLAQSCVFGHRAARSVVRDLDAALPRAPDPHPPAPGDAPAGDVVSALRLEVRQAMTAGAGPLRTAGSLDVAAKALGDAAAAAGPATPALRRDTVELAHVLAVSRLIVRSARLRTESRGVHWREDAPGHGRGWDGVRLQVRLI